MRSWHGQAYDALVIATDSGVYRDIGACDGSMDECDGEDPRVKAAFDGFREAAAMLIAVARSAPAVDGGDNLDRNLREYLRLILTEL
jgi:hypothetical protein